MLKAVLIILAILALCFTLLSLVLAGALGAHGPFKGLNEKRMSKEAGNHTEYDMVKQVKKMDSVWDQKTLFALGSSVTFGFASRGQAVGEYLAARLGMKLVKEAVSGTTMADLKMNSYVNRLKTKMDTQKHCDLFLCQLSTNDSGEKQQIPMGRIAAGTSLDQFDTKTITGAMEYIICYAHQYWNCPVAFYTGSWFDRPKYAQMVDRLLELKKKYDYLIVIDLFTDRNFNDISEEERKLYMNDPVHPTRAGYMLWWGPEMVRQLLQRSDFSTE